MTTIFALGGGGFSMTEAGTSPIDDHLLRVTGVERPRVCFIPTASGDAISYIERFEQAFSTRAETSVLSLFCRTPWGYRDPTMLLEQDLIYVGGGSTANLLALWRHHGVPALLGEAAAAGTVLAGISAGANCWFESSSTDSYGPLAPLQDGLGLIAGSICPHYRGEPDRREKYLGWVGDGTLPGGLAVDDWCAVRFDDGVLTGVVAEEPGHQAYQVRATGSGDVVEEPLPPTLIEW